VSIVATIHHIGFLVDNLESAITRWEDVTGYKFQPIVRYCTDRWHDSSQADLHHSDVRLAFSLDGPPHIELMEFSGSGTHARALGEGVHHLGFAQVPDVDAQLDHLRSLGIGADGRTIGELGETILAFNDPGDFHGVRLEYVGLAPQPLLSEDGRPLRIDEHGLAVID
jgi:catechol 2,3-dioxygenase-like lactoylglutathione lyase family enzyme